MFSRVLLHLHYWKNKCLTILNFCGKKKLLDFLKKMIQDYTIFLLTGVEGWKVPSIRPLETLHNSLTLSKLEAFLIKMTEGSFRTPVPTPPRYPSTPCPSMVNSANSQTLTNFDTRPSTGRLDNILNF